MADSTTRSKDTNARSVNGVERQSPRPDPTAVRHGVYHVLVFLTEMRANPPEYALSLESFDIPSQNLPSGPWPFSTGIFPPKGTRSGICFFLG